MNFWIFMPRGEYLAELIPTTENP